MNQFRIFLNTKFRYYSSLESMEKDLSKNEMLELYQSDITILHRCTVIGSIPFKSFANEVL